MFAESIKTTIQHCLAIILQELLVLYSSLLTCLSITSTLAVTASGAAAWHKYSNRWSAASKSGC